MRSLALALAFAGCASDPGSAAFCDGTPLAGTCAAAFFAPAAACFHPEGQCAHASPPGVVVDCWPNGAAVTTSSADHVHDDLAWTQGGVLCLSAHVEGAGVVRFERDGATLRWDMHGDAIVCPDGSSLAVGKGCPALDALLDAAGGGCAPGSCP